MKYQKEEVAEMLLQSNYIEDERTVEAYQDAWKAWKFAIRNMNKMNVDYILGIHKRLCRNIAPAIAGKIRDCDVYIGGKRKWFISETLIKEELEVLLKVMNEGNPKLTQRCHIEFENLHPFVDGNGRTGRILYNIHRLKMGLSIHIIHEGKEQMEYYKWFK